jgi:putative glutamine amidotransferase
MSSQKPLIGLTLDYQTTPTYSPYPWYALRENYCQTVAQFGGVPFPLSYELDLINDYLSLIQGLIITGGRFDISPDTYGEEHTHEAVTLNAPRTRFESLLLNKALERNLPILGVCGGEQLLNVALGGTLIQHIPDTLPEALNHQQDSLRHQPSHPIKIVEGTELYHLFGEKVTHVNTSHHQAVKDLGKGVVVNAIAPDGIIEGIEVPSKRFCMGVQWHPEFLVSPLDALLFKKFLEIAATT